MRYGMLIAVLALASLPLQADRDFLTTDEADQIRLTQEPNERLKLYAQFAQDRVDLLRSLMAKEQSGRTSLVHETLEDYTRIIETIDVVADDALIRGVDIAAGLAAVAEAEKGFLKELEAIEESDPPDARQYRFALDMAIDTTADSLELSLEDLGDRKAQTAERAKEKRKELESLMTPEMSKERQEATAEMKKEEAEHERKKPTLYRRDEKKPDQK